MTAYIFDTETTGTVEPIEVVEAAWLKIDNPIERNVVGSWEARFKPSKRIELGALAVHHILDEELEGCPASSTFERPTDCEYLIGHNVDYDWKVIGSPPVKRICTLALARAFLPRLDSHSQSALIYHYEREDAGELLQNAHSAMDDVYNCKVVLDHLMKALPLVETWEELWKVSELARIPTKMTFGKHKGMLIRDLPAPYMAWMLKQADMDPYVLKAVRAVRAEARR